MLQDIADPEQSGFFNLQGLVRAMEYQEENNDPIRALLKKLEQLSVDDKEPTLITNEMFRTYLKNQDFDDDDLEDAMK